MMLSGGHSRSLVYHMCIHYFFKKSPYVGCSPVQVFQNPTPYCGQVFFVSHIPTPILGDFGGGERRGHCLKSWAKGPHFFVKLQNYQGTTTILSQR